LLHLGRWLHKLTCSIDETLAVVSACWQRWHVEGCPVETRQNFHPNKCREHRKRPHLTQRPPLSGQKFLPHSSQRKVVIDEVVSIKIL